MIPIIHDDLLVISFYRCNVGLSNLIYRVFIHISDNSLRMVYLSMTVFSGAIATYFFSINFIFSLAIKLYLSISPLEKASSTLLPDPVLEVLRHEIICSPRSKSVFTVSPYSGSVRWWRCKIYLEYPNSEKKLTGLMCQIKVENIALSIARVQFLVLVENLHYSYYGLLEFKPSNSRQS